EQGRQSDPPAPHQTLRYGEDWCAKCHDSCARFTGFPAHDMIPASSSTSQANAGPVEGRPAGTAAHWYAVRTRSRHEKRVHAALVERGIDSFLPLWERWSRWKDRKKKIQ